MLGTFSGFELPVLKNLEQHSIGMPLSATNSKPQLHILPRVRDWFPVPLGKEEQ